MLSVNLLLCLEIVKTLVCGSGGAVDLKPILVFSLVQAEQYDTQPQRKRTKMES